MSQIYVGSGCKRFYCTYLYLVTEIHRDPGEECQVAVGSETGALCNIYLLVLLDLQGPTRSKDTQQILAGKQFSDCCYKL